MEYQYPAVLAHFHEEDREAILKGVQEILTSGNLTQGKHLAAFERLCADSAGTKYAAGVNSGGAALELVLTALDLKGGEVIVPTDTFVATPNSVLRAGGRPVFGDISYDSLSLSYESIKKCLNAQTRGVILVHMFGIMSEEITAIRKLCDEKGLFLLEDAAHAHGASHKTKPAGSLGLAGCFSYYASKILTTGEGGSITTNDEALYRKVCSLRDHGRAGPRNPAFDCAGNNFRLAEIPALLGVYQYQRLSEALSHRQKVAAVYRQQLEKVEEVAAVDPAPHEGHSYWRYPALLSPHIDRSKLQEFMAREYQTRITWMYEPLCHEQPFYAEQNKNQEFSVAKDVMSRLINLPMHHQIDESAAKKIVEGLQQACVKSSKGALR